MEGSSTMQSIFNTVNLLLGLGLLSLPYALRCGGWIPGLTILISTAFITSYTAYILSRCLSLRPGRLLDFADIGEQAFGPHARSIVSILFISELFVTCVAFIILISDSLNALYPTFPMWGCRLVAFVACTGSTFVRQLKYISYASLVGIAASFNLVVVVVLDGVMKRERPGSLWEVEETRMVPRHLGSISLAFGIVMAGFAGHAVLPNIYLDMKDKTRFPHVLAVSFSIALSLYTLVAVCGYAMFGEMTLEEVTMNLAVPGNSVNPFLNVVTTGLIAFIPIPKYALTIAPVALALDQYTGSRLLLTPPRGVQLVLRTVLGGTTAVLPLLVPHFDVVLSLLGCVFSVSVSVVLPAACYLRLFGGWEGRGGGEGRPLLGAGGVGGAVGAGVGGVVGVAGMKGWERVVCWVLVVGGSLAAGVATVGSLWPGVRPV
ncbi:transmembrane amino acid transporter protein-domain-containing protein [Chytridium lagenaria]|nr:transmembrane amino acid transporter protein-domain-containing protein [Chytridium lagenaria]